MTPFARLAARDPGGANVLASAASDLGRRGLLRFEAWSMPRATPVFARFGIPSLEFPEEARPEDYGARWEDAHADVLLTATSHYPGFEAPLWDLARAHGCPSLALLDGWMNLEPRFRLGRPDHVGYIDAAQADELRALGFAGSNLVHTGHPWLSELIRTAKPAPPRPAQPDPLHVLFVSEPVASDVAAGVNAPFGFDEFDAFALLHSVCLDRARSGRAVALEVRFHPYERPEGFLARSLRLPAAPRLTVSSVPASTAARDSLVQADVVAGIGSMLLLEAFVVGRPVVSLQPGTIRGNLFVAGQRGVTPTVVDPRGAPAVLRPLLDDPSAREGLVRRQSAFLQAIGGEVGGALARWLRGRGREATS